RCGSSNRRQAGRSCGPSAREPVERSCPPTSIEADIPCWGGRWEKPRDRPGSIMQGIRPREPRSGNRSGPMSSAKVISPSNPIASEALGTRRGLLVIAIVTLLVAGLGWVAWRRWQFPPVRDWRESVQRGREYLRQGRPALAFQTVSDARDDEVGSGEAVTV